MTLRMQTLHVARRFASASILIIGILMLTACTPPPPTGEELLIEARQANFAFKETIADVQLQFHDGNWTTNMYGSSPSRCGLEDATKYQFRMTRTTEVPWRSPVSAEEASDNIGAWLDTNGWSEIRRTKYDPPITDIVVTAKNPEAGVAKMQINLKIGVEGTATDLIGITATSTCHAGSAFEISQMLVDANPALRN